MYQMLLKILSKVSKMYRKVCVQWSTTCVVCSGCTCVVDVSGVHVRSTCKEYMFSGVQ